MVFDTLTLYLIQALQTLVLFIVPALIVARIRCKRPLQWLRLSPADSGRIAGLDARLVLLGIGIMISAIPLINCLVAWNSSVRLPDSLSGLEQWMQQMEQRAEQVLMTFMTYRNGAWWVLLLNLLVLAVLPAVGEELAFRGVIQEHLFKRANIHVAVWVTAFIFSFMHFQFYGFIPRMLLGALLGYALAWSGRLGYSMVMHATNNALSVLVFYFGTYFWHMSQKELDALGTEHTWWLTLVCTPVMCGLLYLFYNRARALTGGLQPV